MEKQALNRFWPAKIRKEGGIDSYNTCSFAAGHPIRRSFNEVFPFRGLIKRNYWNWQCLTMNNKRDKILHQLIQP
jgi:hypothetical protein